MNQEFYNQLYHHYINIFSPSLITQENNAICYSFDFFYDLLVQSFSNNNSHKAIEKFESFQDNIYFLSFIFSVLSTIQPSNNFETIQSIHLCPSSISSSLNNNCNNINVNNNDTNNVNNNIKSNNFFKSAERLLMVTIFKNMIQKRWKITPDSSSSLDQNYELPFEVKKVVKCFLLNNTINETQTTVFYHKVLLISSLCIYEFQDNLWPEIFSDLLLIITNDKVNMMHRYHASITFYTILSNLHQHNLVGYSLDNLKQICCKIFQPLLRVWTIKSQYLQKYLTNFISYYSSNTNNLSNFYFPIDIEFEIHSQSYFFLTKIIKLCLEMSLPILLANNLTDNIDNMNSKVDCKESDSNSSPSSKTCNPAFVVYSFWKFYFNNLQIFLQQLESFRPLLLALNSLKKTINTNNSKESIIYPPIESSMKIFNESSNANSIKSFYNIKNYLELLQHDCPFSIDSKDSDIDYITESMFPFEKKKNYEGLINIVNIFLKIVKFLSFTPVSLCQILPFEIVPFLKNMTNFYYLWLEKKSKERDETNLILPLKSISISSVMFFSFLLTNQYYDSSIYSQNITDPNLNKFYLLSVEVTNIKNEFFDEARTLNLLKMIFSTYILLTKKDCKFWLKDPNTFFLNYYSLNSNTNSDFNFKCDENSSIRTFSLSILKGLSIFRPKLTHDYLINLIEHQNEVVISLLNTPIEELNSDTGFVNKFSNLNLKSCSNINDSKEQYNLISNYNYSLLFWEGVFTGASALIKFLVCANIDDYIISNIIPLLKKLATIECSLLTDEMNNSFIDDSEDSDDDDDSHVSGESSIIRKFNPQVLKARLINFASVCLPFLDLLTFNRLYDVMINFLNQNHHDYISTLCAVDFINSIFEQSLLFFNRLDNMPNFNIHTEEGCWIPTGFPVLGITNELTLNISQICINNIVSSYIKSFCEIRLMYFDTMIKIIHQLYSFKLCLIVLTVANYRELSNNSQCSCISLNINTETFFNPSNNFPRACPLSRIPEQFKNILVQTNLSFEEWYTKVFDASIAVYNQIKFLWTNLYPDDIFRCQVLNLLSKIILLLGPTSSFILNDIIQIVTSCSHLMDLPYGPKLNHNQSSLYNRKLQNYEVLSFIMNDALDLFLVLIQNTDLIHFEENVETFLGCFNHIINTCFSDSFIVILPEDNLSTILRLGKIIELLMFNLTTIYPNSFTTVLDENFTVDTNKLLNNELKDRFIKNLNDYFSMFSNYNIRLYNNSTGIPKELVHNFGFLFFDFQKELENFFPIVLNIIFCSPSLGINLISKCGLLSRLVFFSIGSSFLNTEVQRLPDEFSLFHVFASFFGSYYYSNKKLLIYSLTIISYAIIEAPDLLLEAISELKHKIRLFIEESNIKLPNGNVLSENENSIILEDGFYLERIVMLMLNRVATMINLRLVGFLRTWIFSLWILIDFKNPESYVNTYPQEELKNNFSLPLSCVPVYYKMKETSIYWSNKLKYYNRIFRWRDILINTTSTHATFLSNLPQDLRLSFIQTELSGLYFFLIRMHPFSRFFFDPLVNFDDIFNNNMMKYTSSSLYKLESNSPNSPPSLPSSSLTSSPPPPPPPFLNLEQIWTPRHDLRLLSSLDYLKRAAMAGKTQCPNWWLYVSRLASPNMYLYFPLANFIKWKLQGNEL